MKKILAAMLFFLACTPVWSAEAVMAGTQGEVFILNSYHPGFTWSDGEQAGIIGVFQDKDENLDPIVEYLDFKRQPDGKHLPELKKLFLRKYQKQKFSVVMALDNPALAFAVDNQAELFKNAPIVFCGINNYTPALLKGHTNVAGIAESLDIEGTINVMLRLHPKTRQILVIHDYTGTGLDVRKEIEALLPRLDARVRFRFLDRLAMDEVLKELEGLPKDSLALLTGFVTDKDGRTYTPIETTRLFSKHSPVPIYTTHEQRLGFGIVGGKLLGGRQHGMNAAGIALRVLSGEKASDIPVVTKSSARYMFDYKVMERFGIPLSGLPEGSIVINQPVSYFAVNRAYILMTLSIIGFLCLTICLLLINVNHRLQAARALRRSERRLRSILDNIPDRATLKDKEGRYLAVNEAWCRLYGLNALDVIGKKPSQIFPADIGEEITKNDNRALKEGRLIRHEQSRITREGKLHWFDVVKAPLYDDQGLVIGTTGIARDITERKLAEEALISSLQEKEILIKEIHHRVKNNLQVISSLLNLQSTYVKDPEALVMFRESMDRVRAMARIHEKLYQSKDFTRISFGDYINELISQLYSSYGITPESITLNARIEDVSLGIDSAIPCGLIINELVSNALKHAFPFTGAESVERGAESREDEEKEKERKNKITISLREEQGQESLDSTLHACPRIAGALPSPLSAQPSTLSAQPSTLLTLTVSDNGIGFPDDIDFRNTTSLGMQLVNELTEQLEGTIELIRDKGTAFTVTFAKEI